MRGYDPRTCGLRNRCSTTELHRRRDGGCSRRTARRWQATRRAPSSSRSPPPAHPSATSTPSSRRLSAPTSPPFSHPSCACSSSRKIASRKSPRLSDSPASLRSPRSTCVRVDPIGTPAAASVDPLPSAEIACVSDALRNRCSTTELHRRGFRGDYPNARPRASPRRRQLSTSDRRGKRGPAGQSVVRASANHAAAAAPPISSHSPSSWAPASASRACSRARSRDGGTTC